MSSVDYVRERMKKYAQEMGLDVTGIAEEAGLSKGTVRNLMENKSNVMPDLSTIDKLAKLFNIPAHVMLIPVANEHMNDEECGELVKAFEYAYPKMSDKEKKIITVMIDVQDR